MADKQLAESAWKAFGKGKDYKDAGLLKALAALDKAEKAGSAEWLVALEAVGKEVADLRAQHKADKALVAQLADLDKALARERKAAEKLGQSEARSADEDAEDDSPAVLTSKLVPLLREVRKGGVMQALIAHAGKVAAVSLARRPIGPPRRKVLAEFMGSPGGIKYVAATCMLEANAVTFVVEAGAAGLAKKLRQALLEQTELRLKVRVRGNAPDDVDEDGENEEEGEGSVAGTPAAAAAAADPEPAADAGGAFNARLALLVPRVKANPQAQLQGRPLATVVAQAGALARDRRYDEATKLLSAIEKVLDAPALSLVQLGKARLDWGRAREHAVAEFRRLRQLLVDEYEGDPEEAATLQRVTRHLDGLVASVDDSLGGTLDRLLNAATDARPPLQGRARELILQMQQRLDQDEVLGGIDGNEYAPDMRVAAPLREALAAIRSSLG